MPPVRPRLEWHAQVWTIIAGVIAVITFMVTIAKCDTGATGATTPGPEGSSAAGAPTAVGVQGSTPSVSTPPAPSIVVRFLGNHSQDEEVPPDELPYINGLTSVREAPQDIGGTTYTRNVTFGLVCSDTSDKYVDYNLSRYFDTFTARVGISDTSKSRKFHFEVSVDDRRVVNLTLGRGESKKLKIPVSNALRLQLSACSIDESPILEDSTGGVFADPQVEGSSDKVPPPTASSTE